MTRLIDLKVPGGTDPLVGLLMGQIQDAYEQLKKAIAEMTAEQLDYRGPTGDMNSTGTLINHILAADLFFAYKRLSPTQEEIPAHWDGVVDRTGGMANPLPFVGGLDAAAWTARIERVQAELLPLVARLRDADLERPWQPPNRDFQLTARWLLWHWGEHTMGHVGQIRVLKKLATRSAAD
jgi:uncharacterized damage-inducible protein DinB